MKGLSIGARLAWRISAIEAAAAKHQFIEKEHIVIGIFSLEKVLSSQSGRFKLSFKDKEVLQDERDTLEYILRRFGTNSTSLRRSIRKRLGKGEYLPTEKVVHRSEDCKKEFAQAEELARSSENIMILHLLAAILKHPGDIIQDVLNETNINTNDLRNQALKQVGEEEPKKIKVEVTRGFEIAGDAFKFFIRIENSLDYAISDVVVGIKLPNTLKLDVKTSSHQYNIGTIAPHKFASAIFYLYCDACADTEINASIEFTDPKGKYQIAKMEPFQIVTCKYVQPRVITKDKFQQKLDAMDRKIIKIPIVYGVPNEEIMKRLKDRLTMSVISSKPKELEMFGNTKDGTGIGLKSILQEKEGKKVLTATVFGKNQQVQMGILADIMEAVKQMREEMHMRFDELEDILENIIKKIPNRNEFLGAAYEGDLDEYLMTNRELLESIKGLHEKLGDINKTVEVLVDRTLEQQLDYSVQLGGGADDKGIYIVNSPFSAELFINSKFEARLIEIKLESNTILKQAEFNGEEMHIEHNIVTIDGNLVPGYDHKIELKIDTPKEKIPLLLDSRIMIKLRNNMYKISLITDPIQIKMGKVMWVKAKKILNLVLKKGAELILPKISERLETIIKKK